MRLKYHCKFFETILLLIDITSLYWRTISTSFIKSKDEILVQKTTTSLHEKKTGRCQWAIIFCIDVHIALTPSPVCRRSPEPDLPPPCGRHKWMALVPMAHVVVCCLSIKICEVLIPTGEIYFSLPAFCFQHTFHFTNGLILCYVFLKDWLQMILTLKELLHSDGHVVRR